MYKEKHSGNQYESVVFDKATNSTEFDFNNVTVKGGPVSGVGDKGNKNCFSSMMFTDESLNKEYIALMS